MIRYLKNRLHAYVQGIIAEKIDTIAELATMKVNLPALSRQAAEQVDLEVVAEMLADRVKTGHTVEYDLLAEHISVEEVAEQFDLTDIAGHLDYADLAGHLDYSSLAGEIDTSDMDDDVAEHVEVDAEEVAEHLDYKRLAVALLDAVRAGT